MATTNGGSTDMGKIIASMNEVAIGNAGTTWANAPAAERSKVQSYAGPVPLETAVGIVGWSPVAFEVSTLVDPTTMESYTVPARFGQAIGRVRPDGSRAIINMAGEGFAAAKELHNVMRENVYAAADANLDITLAACNNDGEFLCLQMQPREGLNIGGIEAGIVPILTMLSSLTGQSKTRLTTGSMRLFCTNQLRAFNLQIAAQYGMKRTRNAIANVYTPAQLHEAMEFSYAETAELCAELERLANIDVSDAQLRQVLDIWHPLVNAEGVAKEGRGHTIAENNRGTLVRLLDRDPRVNMGRTVAGLWQAHNTYQHWEMTARGNDNRISRMAERGSLTESDKLDAEFMAIVAGVIPETTRALATV